MKINDKTLLEQIGCRWFEFDWKDIAPDELSNVYLKNVPTHFTGRFRYDPVCMLKTVLFGFMTNGYISLRELEDSCRVNIRFMYLMDHKTPSYRTFGYFINEIRSDSIEEIFCDINKKIFEIENVDLQHLHIDGSKFEANANKYFWFLSDKTYTNSTTN